MERRYFTLKAAMIVLALGTATFGYAFGSANVGHTYARSHYSAATTAQVTMAKMGSAVGHAILRVVEFFHGETPPTSPL
ncbi:MAG TPA: hypothetical protein VML19_25470 [Verrucomicrobiae bacterium]|nr:hypothetical protein [Verrucomicrobiae bacterium]